MEDTTKEDIEAMKAYISDNCNRIDKLNADNAEKYERIEKLQANCEHDFELQGHFAGAVFECKNCGFIGGA